MSAGRSLLTLCCGVLVPLMTFAQSPVDLPVGSAAPPASDNVRSSSSVAFLELPDAPAPNAPQRTPQNQSQSQTSSSGQKQNEQQQPQSGNAPTLGDLGFTPQQTLANAEMQKRLNQRTHDLKMHQTLGLITAVPMCATVLVAGGAKSKRDRRNANGTVTGPSTSGVDLHVALGSATVALYGATAYYAIIAPKIPGVEPKGAIRWHRDLVWIHAPGMVLTPILGAMALNQENNGEHVHGIASAHSYVAWTTVLAYGASIVAVSWPIRLKFWEKK
ncbi:MAG TPA: hypothetical protein VHE33_07030 [Acidobacteriaceae bacterium]|nr:hypothetical protein [Acidobacteriaceae bacterium]